MTIFKVDGMSCGHCVAAVTRSIKQAMPSAEVEVDLARGQVRVEPAVDTAAVAAAIEKAGYKVSVARP
ncbi:MAG: heavy-metal-associated domain-containing protein [Alphaproteobacteria bacterium]|nr:heavy-metal-associated domain-containing protein [Alphaproteobacteria bacterium]